MQLGRRQATEGELWPACAAAGALPGESLHCSQQAFLVGFSGSVQFLSFFGCVHSV